MHIVDVWDAYGNIKQQSEKINTELNNFFSKRGVAWCAAEQEGCHSAPRLYLAPDQHMLIVFQLNENEVDFRKNSFGTAEESLGWHVMSLLDFELRCLGAVLTLL